MPRRPDYLARIAKADTLYREAGERLAAAGAARRQMIAEAVAHGVPIDEVAKLLGQTYESVRRVAAEINGPRPVGRPRRLR